MKHTTLLLWLLFVPFWANSQPEGYTGVTYDWRNEIIYHVMPRSFYDSNGDRHGDLNGFVEKLDYLQELGVTTILFTPLYESGFYHNYFPTDYEKIDQEYGTKEDYLNFVKAVHKRGMKFLMDMETQYAQSGHIWLDDSYQNPASAYTDFIYYADAENKFPEQIFMPANSPLFDFKAWPNDTHNIVLLDLNHKKVRQWMIDFYVHWVDPNQDGNFDDGVDGFRIDHIMDDLDYKGIFTNMYQEVWKPIFMACKQVNPEIFVLGEQSNWSHYGEEMVKASGADAAFSFPLRFALAGVEGTDDMYADPSETGVIMEPSKIHAQVAETLKRFSGNTFSINFLENHDTNRWASVVKNNEGQMRTGAVLNLLLPGVPSIYYGQELGMTGTTHEWGFDANHLPIREAFPWSANADANGMAAFYKETGEWWDISIYQTGAAKQMALPAQKGDPNSLLNFYKSLINLRKKEAAFRQGDYQSIELENNNLMAFSRQAGNEKVWVILNLDGKPQTLNSKLLKAWKAKPIAGEMKQSGKETELKGYGFVVLKK